MSVDLFRDKEDTFVVPTGCATGCTSAAEVALERALLHSSHVPRGGTSLTLKAEETMGARWLMKPFRALRFACYHLVAQPVGRATFLLQKTPQEGRKHE